MWSFVKRFLCSVHFKRHREAGGVLNGEYVHFPRELGAKLGIWSMPASPNAKLRISSVCYN